MWILSWSSDRLLLMMPFQSSPVLVSVEYILAYVDEGEKSGMIAHEESHIMENTLQLEAFSITMMMTLSADVCYIDLMESKNYNLKVLKEFHHSHIPLCKGGFQNVVGVVESHTILKAMIDGTLDFAEFSMNPPLFIPYSLSVIDLLRVLREKKNAFAFVVSEFGVTDGIVTLNDILLSIVGDVMPISKSSEEILAYKHEDGYWVLDGLLSIYNMKTLLDIQELPQEDLDNFHTVGGFVLSSLGRIPLKKAMS